MRKRLVVLLTMLAAILGVWFPGGAAALTCTPPEDQLWGLPVLVRAEVVAVTPATTVPKAEAVTLRMHRYYKGAGPTEVVIRYHSGGWVPIDRPGTEVIMGLWRDGRQLGADACTLRIRTESTNRFEIEMESRIERLFGPGRPPTDAPGSPRATWILVGVLALGFGLGAALLRQRRSRD